MTAITHLLVVLTIIYFSGIVIGLVVLLLKLAADVDIHKIFNNASSKESVEFDLKWLKLLPVWPIEIPKGFVRFLQNAQNIADNS